ncbi:MAG: PEP/pyruvate-binding domain-containing protein [Rhodocyclaceae bacterium]|nr:PEP/pyruvate-binding domain-containing protein [Rhodocyclaceae bacterium]MDZ4215842.1 PEP/pyruvate-binding domain-containing protein [Rhodocyclaceae bacterium]
MANAFHPTTGLPELDGVLHGVQPGDNIVWQIESFAMYRALVEPYAAAARREGLRLIYFRFADHPPLLDDAETYHPDPEEGFDTFVDQVHTVIEAAGRETLYVFDCLSPLADAWQSDRMLGNFFRLTCPRLLDLDTVTYFGVFRNRHAPPAIGVITATTQFLIDVFACREKLYLRPVKVQHRSAAAMNLIHAWEPGDHFRPVRDSGTVSEILADSQWPGLEDSPLAGHWQQRFAAAKLVAATRQAGCIDPAETAWFVRLSRMLFPVDPSMACLIDEYLRLDDLVTVRTRMIGSGTIGGKALGMLLARAVLRRDAPQLDTRLEAHDSFYIGAEVFDTFLVHNGLWWIRRRQRDPARYLEEVEEAHTRVLAGHFSPTVRHQFEGMLEYFGEWPFIVRSSSRLEDRYGNAFAGQYVSVFCANRGPWEDRLESLLDAVRQVYASTMSEQALRYRERRGLLGENEQMAALIMRVSGTAGGPYFHPHAAGVGLSVNPYRWNPRIDMKAGVIRLVAGLGTRAVDRTDDDYTRLVALNAPELRPETSFGDIARHAQRRMDAIDLDADRIVSGSFADMVRDQADFPLELFTTREESGKPAFLTFDRLLSETLFVADLRDMLATLHAAYRHPVEIEFALNVLPEGGYRINLLQCRPVQMRSVDSGKDIAPCFERPALIEAQGAVIGPSRHIRPDRLVYVVPAHYGAMNQSARVDVARLIGRINQASSDRTLVVLGPGRWGTRDPWLGLPVSFNEINRVAALCEIVAMNENLVPDVSLGTHFLNELIEADMLYFALFPGRPGNAIDESFLLGQPNRLTEILPGQETHAEVVRVIDFPACVAQLFADAESQRVAIQVDRR